jgi:hypothetical protein
VVTLVTDRAVPPDAPGFNVGAPGGFTSPDLTALVERAGAALASPAARWTPEDIEAVVQAWRLKNLPMPPGVRAAGDRAAAIGGSVGGNVVTGDQTTVTIGQAVFVDQGTALQALLAIKTYRKERLSQLRPAVADFVDRTDDLTKLKSQVIAKAQTQRKRIIGIFPKAQRRPGVGTSELALKLAWALAKSTKCARDGQIFFRMRGSTATPHQVSDFHKHVVSYMDPLAQVSSDPDRLAVDYYDSLQDKRLLLLVDDVDSRASGEQLQTLIPPEGCTLIYTARESVILPGMAHHLLDCLNPEDAAMLLCGIAAQIGACAPAIAELCEYVPGALRQAGSTLAKISSFSPTQYEERLRRQRLELREDPLQASVNLHALLSLETRR